MDAEEEVIELREKVSDLRMILFEVYTFLKRIAPSSDVYHRVREALGYRE